MEAQKSEHIFPKSHNKWESKILTARLPPRTHSTACSNPSREFSIGKPGARGQGSLRTDLDQCTVSVSHSRGGGDLLDTSDDTPHPGLV